MIPNPNRAYLYQIYSLHTHFWDVEFQFSSFVVLKCFPSQRSFRWPFFSRWTSNNSKYEKDGIKLMFPKTKWVYMILMGMLEKICTYSLLPVLRSLTTTTCSRKFKPPEPWLDKRLYSYLDVKISLLKIKR